MICRGHGAAYEVGVEGDYDVVSFWAARLGDREPDEGQVGGLRTCSGLFSGLCRDRVVLLVIPVPGLDSFPSEVRWELNLDLWNTNRDEVGTERAKDVSIGPPLSLVSGLACHEGTVPISARRRAHSVALR